MENAKSSQLKTQPQAEIDGIVVNGVELVPHNPPECGNVKRVCDPEDLFEMIEQCKICGRCI